MEDEFVLDLDADPTGTHLQLYVPIVPVELVIAFGKPSGGDQYKTSGEYTFRHIQSDSVITVYDWKSTQLYDGCGWDPDTFWNSNEAYDFHIGANKTLLADKFVQWLIQKIK